MVVINWGKSGLLCKLEQWGENLIQNVAAAILTELVNSPASLVHPLPAVSPEGLHLDL